MCTASVNIPEINENPNYVIIKNYAENIGILEALEEADIVRRIDSYEINHFGTTVWLCKIISGFKPHWQIFKGIANNLEKIVHNTEVPNFLDKEKMFSVN